MRTDVKVGLIAGVVLFGGVIAYSTLHKTNNTQQIAPSQHGLMAREVATGFGPTPAAADVVVIPPSTPATAPGDPFAEAPGATRPSGFPSDLGTTHNPTPTESDPFATTPTTPTTPRSSEPFPSHPTPHTDPFASTPTEHTPSIDTPISEGTGGSYAIVSGDTLSKIAKAKHVTLKALQAANPTADSSHLKIGQKITIPAASSTPSTPSTTGKTASGKTTSGKAAHTTAGTSTVPVGGTTYKVKAGDNLMKIAKALYGDASQYSKILRANKNQITNEDQIKEGMTLKIPH